MAQRSPLVASLILTLSIASACTNGEPGGQPGTAGTTSAGAAGTNATGTAGTTAAGAAGTSATGTAGTSATGAAGTSATGAAGTAAAGSGAAGTNATGAAGAGAAGTGAGGTGTPLPNVGTDGDGDFMIGPTYAPDVASKYVAGTPIGKQLAFKMTAAESTIYGPTSATPARTQFNRNVWVYVPQQYVAGTPAPLLVVLDGNYACWWGNDVPHPVNTGTNLKDAANLPRILDNFIAAKKLPKIVAVFIEAGGGDGGSSQRGLEYDTVSGVFAEYVEKEVLPRVISEAQKQLQLNLAFTKDPSGRGTLGGSSGGAGALSMAWWHPDLFSRVITYSGTFVRQASPENPLYPHGAWSYHDYDPYNAAMPNGLIVKEPGQKPIRHWLEVGTNDMGAAGGPETYRNFLLANQRMAASYKTKAYHYHFDLAQGAGHLDVGGAVAQTLPAAMLYVWRGYPVD